MLIREETSVVPHAAHSHGVVPLLGGLGMQQGIPAAGGPPAHALDAQQAARPTANSTQSITRPRAPSSMAPSSGGGGVSRNHSTAQHGRRHSQRAGTAHARHLRQLRIMDQAGNIMFANYCLQRRVQQSAACIVMQWWGRGTPGHLAEVMLLASPALLYRTWGRLLRTDLS